MTRWLAIRDPSGTWRAAIVLGLITSTYSTLLASLGAAPLAGRDVAIDWMVVGTIPLRAAAIDSPPSWGAIIAGILTHQAADFGWALVFFGVLARWTRALRPGVVLMLALPWAAATSAFEYYIVLPFWKPLFVLEQPYWVGLAVHTTSAIGYPLFPWLRGRLILRRDLPGAAFGPRWAIALSVLAGAVMFLAVLHGLRLDPVWPFIDAAVREDQQRFLRRMTAHHEIGVMLANHAIERASTSVRDGIVGLTLQELGELMHAAQESEIKMMNAFWGSFFGGDIPQLREHEHQTMPGMVPPGTLSALAALPAGPKFERIFVRVMIDHHRGAIAMAEEVMGQIRDLRLNALAASIAHAQRGQMSIMEDLASRIEPPPRAEDARPSLQHSRF